MESSGSRNESLHLGRFSPVAALRVNPDQDDRCLEMGACRSFGDTAPEIRSEREAVPGDIPQQTTGHLGFAQQQVPGLTVKTACVHAHAGTQHRTEPASPRSCGA